MLAGTSTDWVRVAQPAVALARGLVDVVDVLDPDGQGIVSGRMAISIIGHVPSTPPQIGGRWLISAFEPA